MTSGIRGNAMGCMARRMVVVALLGSLVASPGCRRKGTPTSPGAGTVYYEGPMRPKGGGSPAPASPR